MLNYRPNGRRWLGKALKRLHVCTVHQHYQNTFFIIPTDAHNYKITGMLKTIKIPIFAPTCFDSCRNHHQGAISCLAKTTIMILLYSSLMMPWRQTSLCASVRYTCTARLHNRLLCRHDIDHVINDEHNRIIIVVLARHEIATWWWLLREPKHVRAIVGILIVFNIPVIL
jgi:hypothetical protein